MAISHPTKILVVEDNGPVRMLAADSLRDEGFEVIEALNGDDAVALLDSDQHFDVLFTDVRMPGARDGVDVAEYVRESRPELPVLIASGYAAQLTTRLQKLGPPTTFINKPYNLEIMVDVVKRLTGNA